MTDPLYSVGQPVAVCTTCLSVIVPKTVVIEREFHYPGLWRDGSDPALFKEFGAGWAYRVEAFPCDTEGFRTWFSEHCLRPIDPGEYLSDSAPQKLETTL